MAENRNTGGLFPTSSVFGLPDQTGGLFTPQQAPRIATPRAPSERQLQAQAAAAQEAQIAGITQSLRSQPEWQNSTPIRKRELLDAWMQTQWMPIRQQMSDPLQAAQLEAAITGPLRQDISAQEAQASTGRLGDTWRGAVASTGNIINQAVNQAPAAYQQAQIDNLDSEIAVYQQLLAEGSDTPSVEAWGSTISMPRAEAEQRLNALLQDRATYATARNENAADAQRYQATIDQLRNDRSYGQQMRDLRVQELAQTGTDTPMFDAALEGGVTDAAANILQIAAENAPSTAVSLGVAAAGQAVGIPIPLTLAATGGLLGAGDAGGGGYDAIMQMTPAQLAQSPEYQQLLDSGYSQQGAKEVLAARAFGTAAPLGAATGAALNLIGPEAIISRALPGAVRSTIASAAARTGAPRVAAAVGTAAVGAASEYPDEYLQAVAGNYGQQQATGISGNLTEGAHDQGLIGILAGGPLSGAGGVAEYARTTPAAAPAANPTIPNTRDTGAGISTPPVRPTSSSGITQPPASAITPTSPVPTTSAAESFATNAVGILTAENATPLTPEQVTGLFAEARAAEIAGLPNSNIEQVLSNIQINRGLTNTDTGSITEQYAAYLNANPITDEVVATTTQTEAVPLAEAVANAMQTNTINEVDTNGGFDTAGTIPANPTGADINSRMETYSSTGNAEPASIRDANAPSISGEPTGAGLSGAGQPQQSANAGNQTADGTVGVDTAVNSAVSGPDNTGLPRTSTQAGTGAGVIGDSTSQRTNDVGGTASISRSAAGSNPVVGDTVSWSGGFRGAPTLTGTVTRSANGKIDLRVGNAIIGNLDVSRIVPTPAEQVSEQTDTAPDAPVIPSVEQISEPVSPQVTPSGYDTESLARKADALLDNEAFSDYADEAYSLSAALERGDFAEADYISGYLYAEGLRQFAPPMVNTGEGGASLESALRTLTPPERQALQEAFEQQRDAGELTPDMDSHQAWVGTMVQSEIEVRSGGEPLTPLLDRLVEAVRNTIRKLATAMQALVLAVTVNYAVNVNDAVASQGYANVGTVEVQQVLSQPANVVNGWVRQAGDNQGQRYIIADKAAGMLHIMSAEGTVLESAPALYGKKQGDGMTVGETPAGIFLLHHQPAPTAYGGDLQQFATAPDGDVYAIHRVLTTNPRQNRQGRLNTPTPDDNRISLGCINVPADIYNQYLTQGFQGKLYILPDQEDITTTFAAIAEQNAKVALRVGETLPEELNDATSQAYNDSTAVLASSDLDAAGTIAANDVDAVADSVSSEQSNTGNDSIILAGLLAGLVRRRNSRNAEPLTSTEAPIPPTGDTSTATDDIADSASGITEVPEEGIRAPRRYTTARRADRLRAAAWKMRRAYADAATPLLEWLHTQAERILGAEYDTHPVWQTWALILGRRDAAARDMKHRYIDPFNRLARDIARRTGREITLVGKDIATWTTVSHIRTEASAAHRNHLQQNVIAAAALPPSEAGPALIAAQEALRAYDSYQAGVGPRVATPGGMSNIEADNILQYIESLGYTMEELQSAQAMLTNAARAATQMRIENGTLTEEDLAMWQADNNFQNYIPLYVDHSYDGIFLGTSTYNPVGDFRREGVMTSDRLLNGLEAVTQYINRASAEVSSAPFKSELNALYERLRAQGDTHGLNRYNLATNPQFVPREAREARGFVHTIREPQADGTVRTVRYKLWFDDTNITNALLGQATIAHGLENEGRLTNNIRNLTRLYSRGVTQYDPTFAPTNMMKDFMERTANLVGRDMQTVSGATVSGGRLSAQTIAHGANPRLIRDIADSLINNNDTTFYGRYFRELERAGGLSTMSDLLARDSETLVRELRRTVGVRNVTAAMARGVMYWNESFNLAPVVASYAAMRENGVGVEDAAFRTLDLLNYRRQGQTVQNLRLNVLYPFVKPVFQSGANITRTLGFSPGQDNWLSPTPAARRGRIAFAGTFIASTVLYGLASASAGDDEDAGNRVDSIPMSSISRFIPLYYGDNNDRYIKLPVGYGLPQVAWIAAVSLDRARRGVMSYGDASAEIALAFAKNMVPDTAPEYSFKDHPIEWLAMTISPTILSAPVQLAANINTFGNPITYGSRAIGARAADSGRARTPDVWKRVADNIQSVTGLDFYPEQVRHVVQSYALGPLRGAVTWLEEEDNFKAVSGLSTAQEQGWAATTIGIQKWWGADHAIASRMYYSRARKIEKFLYDNGIETTSPQNRGVEGAKEEMIARQLMARGVAPEQIRDIILYFQTAKEIRKVNTNLNTQTRVYGKSGLTSQDLRPIFEASGQQQEIYMRQFLNATGTWI